LPNRITTGSNENESELSLPVVKAEIGNVSDPGIQKAAHFRHEADSIMLNGRESRRLANRVQRLF